MLSAAARVRPWLLQGLPEMPIRGIHLRNVSITAERGIACSDAQNITFDNVQILNAKGPVATLTGSRDVFINKLAYAPGVEALFKVQGTNNAAITVKNTDLKAAAKDFVFDNGATRDAFKIE